MTENQKKIREFIKKRRSNRKIELCVHVALWVVTVVLLAFLNGYLGAFLPLAVAFVVLTYRTLQLLLDKTVSVFTKEIRGTIVRNDKRSVVYNKQTTGGFGAGEPRPYQTYSARVTVGTIYIKTEDGVVVPLGKYHEDVAEFLEEGDEVVRFEGSRYPLILNEPPSRQKWLCPACGSVLPDGRDCDRCGLEFSLIG